MSDWLLSLEGTEAGHRAALILALSAAFLHAVFGALQKGAHDPWLTRGAVDLFMFWLALPVALFVVPWPEGSQWGLLLGALAIHFVYKVGMALAYSRGAFTVVYPVVRGTGPLFTVIGAWAIFGETFAPMQWVGVAVLLVGIFGLAVYNLIFIEVQRESLVPALWIALATGGLVAVYTTWDAMGIRATPNPFTFLAWFFVITAVDFPVIAYVRWRRMDAPPPLAPLLKRGFLGAFIAFGSFGSIMMATRLDKVGEAAVLRETSTVFAALIGWLVLGETVGPRRMALMALIALGAVIVEFSG
ncbi:DMT family transporter [Oceaniovalibus sp. ACAM 378]|jgi:drug/metabolite transporter (DMT)-like permease|uniref:DMT family transporter n=1 Tax=Oceaniovalibus sp. ACAM 378 TaxID=2599923 RepID=UPI0011D41CA4|nr:DMT family transporter [Oceaniovalibus sp. ACAM 378]TYB91203.1 EamA family transporter [Oceaniovalibus sp. ACAM 378]